MKTIVCLFSFVAIFTSPLSWAEKNPFITCVAESDLGGKTMLLNLYIKNQQPLPSDRRMQRVEGIWLLGVQNGYVLDQGKFKGKVAPLEFYGGWVFLNLSSTDGKPSQLRVFNRSAKRVTFVFGGKSFTCQGKWL